METTDTLDPVRSRALELATVFVSSFQSPKNSGQVVFIARGFEEYLRTGEEPDWDAIKASRAA